MKYLVINVPNREGIKVNYSGMVWDTEEKAHEKARDYLKVTPNGESFVFHLDSADSLRLSVPPISINPVRV